MNFSLEQLFTFVTVYEYLSFSKAAAKLNKHRTTVGQVITKLEEQLAITLFERIGRSVEPTEDGHFLYNYAKQIIEQVRVFDKIALSLSYGGLERIMIAYPSFVPHQALYLIREQLLLDFPNLRVEYIVRDGPAIKQGIMDGSIHFGLVNVHESTAMHSMDATLLGHVEFLPFGQTDGKLAQLDKNAIYNVLKTERQIMLKSLVDESLGEKFLFSANHEQVDQLALLIRMLQEGHGWAWLPKAFAKPQFAIAGVSPLATDAMLEGLKLPIALWCPHTKNIKDVKRSIIVAIQDYIKSYKG